jgi:hypothetical protein
LVARAWFLRVVAFGWHNRASSAPIPFLQAVERECRRGPGDVLDVGSGLTTIVASAAVRGSGRRVVSLEHKQRWADRVKAATRWSPQVRVLQLPLVDRGDYAWYDLDLGDLPRPVGLVLCDGPPGTTEGGRYGLLPSVATSLLPSALVLLDDADRPGEAEVIERWRDGFDVQVEMVRNASRTFARVTVPGEPEKNG